MLVAGFKKNGGSPCHRCLVDKSQIFKLGAPSDTERQSKVRDEAKQKLLVNSARAEISAGFAVDGDRVESHLKAQSIVPVHNAFSSRLADIPVKIIPALVVDLMHEFEIGVWKRMFIHLIRLLEAFTSLDLRGPTLTGDLDSRYRSTPSFGRDGIRSFAENASEMNRRAARDYEDLLQCAIPAFESLLPEPHNTALKKLLYIYAQWHALAKLRMHNDMTLQLLDYTTTWLGAQTRLFNHTTCSRIATTELQKESDAREQRGSTGKNKDKDKGKGPSTRKPVKFNIFTIKFHFLGDYTPIIRRFGTTDSFSTETGELYHRLPKSWFERTDGRDFVDQLTQIERRRARLDEIRQASAQPRNAGAGGSLQRVPPSEGASKGSPAVVDGSPAEVKGSSAADGGTSAEDRGSPADDGGTPVEDRRPPAEDKKPPTDIEDSFGRRYIIGTNQNLPIDITFFAHTSEIPYQDPYLNNFVQKLKRHLLPRIIKILGFKTDVLQEHDWVNISLSRLYAHKLLHVNYTTYDVRRAQDIIHVNTTQSNVMLRNELAFPDKPEPLSGPLHPYRYAKVIGIYHANVTYVGALPNGARNLTAHRLDFVWIHRYDIVEFDNEFALDHLSLHPITSDGALDFLDPSEIVRGVHLIPQFSLGMKPASTPPSKCVPPQDVWDKYYINKFADRDSFMRYQYGMAVGHVYMRRVHPSLRKTAVPALPADFNHYTSFAGGEDSALMEGMGEDGEPTYVEPGSDDSDRGEYDDGY